MNDRIEICLEQLKKREYRKSRIHIEIQQPIEEYPPFIPVSSSEYADELRKALAIEKPRLLDNDNFGFNRSTDKPDWWGCSNITPDYPGVMNKGFDGIIAEIKQSISKTDDPEKISYGNDMITVLQLCLDVCDDFKESIRDKNHKLYEALCHVPHGKAQSFYEACVFVKICNYFLRVGFSNHIGLGRFDVYMYPFFKNDIKNGVSVEEIFETLEEFYISLNYDTDLYIGVQQGDNGQSMVLGGYDLDGNSMYNELSHMCMQASLELSLIDPKINLRVNKNTPDELFEYGTLLTKQGLGFPQYCNDDVVIPGLIKLGYAPADAANYTVAACWEFIIPGCAADTPNIAVMNFPLVVQRVTESKLAQCENFDEFMRYVKEEVAAEVRNLIENPGLVPWKNPLMSAMTEGCAQTLTDMWHGGTKYRNLGSHGAGIATATDALAAIKKHVFDDKTFTAAELLKALKDNFEGHEELRNVLKNSPKMGNNDDYADNISIELMKAFSVSMNNKPNGIGGIWRAGTGSAQEYLRSAKKCPATADGRKNYEPYSSSFSPSIGVKTNGLLSVIQSFTKYDMTEIINGGPLTIEIHDSVFRNDIGIKKTAQLVKAYITLGGHQLQLNSINRDTLLDAQRHPENYPDLIVRVWGWSGYFNELELEYQDHIINRLEYTL